MTYKQPYELARRNRRTNTFDAWSYPHEAFLAGAVQPDATHATSRIRCDFADIHARPFRALGERRVFAIGSCFARQIEAALLRRGMLVPSAEAAPFGERPDLFQPPPNKAGNHFLNRYNTPSILQEIQVLVNGFPAEDSNWLLYQNGQDWVDLHYCLFVPEVSRNECLERRTIVRNLLYSALKRSNTFIVTLGLCEAWYDVQAGSYLNVMPPPRAAAAEPGRFEFHFLDYDDNLRALAGVFEIVSALKGEEAFDFVVTVSPIPLVTTFTSDDIVIANTEAKAILRSVAGEVARRFPNVTYFPSYEIVMNSAPLSAWQADGVHVQPKMSDHVVSSFMRLFDSAASPSVDGVLRS